jgi:hypothetical protein
MEANFTFPARNGREQYALLLAGELWPALMRAGLGGELFLLKSEYEGRMEITLGSASLICVRVVSCGSTRGPGLTGAFCCLAGEVGGPQTIKTARY